MLWYFQRRIHTASGRVIDEADSYTEAQERWPGVTVLFGCPGSVMV